ncbi:hypothetical protein GF362_01985 [Candidatus Dojkabacteria bacterium]|nr:hypothetical protein [Candidatus Dojkabacteria bacterium]
MANFDGTGPTGLGPMTGRRMGYCGMGLGMGRRAGFGRGGMGRGCTFGFWARPTKDEIKGYKELLKEELAEIQKIEDEYEEDENEE